MPGSRKFTLISMVNIVVSIYMLQDDAGAGKITLISMVNIFLRIYVWQDDASIREIYVKNSH